MQQAAHLCTFQAYQDHQGVSFDSADSFMKQQQLLNPCCHDCSTSCSPSQSQAGLSTYVQPVACFMIMSCQIGAGYSKCQQLFTVVLRLMNSKVLTCVMALAQ